MTDDYGNECNDVVAERDALRAEVAELQQDYDECTDSRIKFMNEAESLRAEVAELRAKWDSVPWHGLRIAVETAPSQPDDVISKAFTWLIQHGPQEDKQ